MKNKAATKHSLSNTEIIREIPKACSDELAAVEFFEAQRWGDTPACVHCGSVEVYKMTDAKTGERSKRFLWRCRDCGQQFTVRIGTVFEESRLELRHWAYAFWRAATSKKGVSALEIKRHCQISYKSALFLMNRIRFAMAPDDNAPKLTGNVECDETYIGPRKPRYKGTSKRGRGTSKIPVFCAVERDGQIRRRIVPDVTTETIEDAIREEVDRRARLITDEFSAYRRIGPEYAGHDTVCHATKEYARGDVHTNTAESSHALVKRGIVGIYHNVSSEYLHRYLWHFDFLWNNRKLNDGERVILAIQAAEGKRLMYKPPIRKETM
ncbi:MAG TPA: IS1595 family transposase [Candidatus Angelobacter sp.]|nr:IS1595 family transposase [Candidatus Angelobacter sp.]